MNEECINCEWYNKPYWSIISPCSNCRKKFNKKSVTVTQYSINIDKKELHKEIEQLQQENQSLKKQNEYLRSGEYLNQLKFERNLLEDIVQNGGVSEEDKEFIDMTHRNTELLEENQSLKDRIKKAYIQFYDMFYHQLGYKHDFDETDLKEIHKLENLLKGDK